MNRARLLLAAAVVAGAGVAAGVAAAAGGDGGTAGPAPSAPAAVSAAVSSAPVPPSEPVPVVVPGRPGEPNRVADGARVSAPAQAPHNGIDAAFVQMMIPHHQQALRMAELAPGRAGDPRVAAVAERIRLAQGAELPQLQTWLSTRGLPATPPGHDHAAMPGMQGQAALDALAAARGADFDRRFVAMMTEHHRGALRMVGDVLSGGADQMLGELANEIGVEQAAEINRMTSLVR
ncbi:DUF305 domain-containing protein [Spirilliplanes yamanashiensis]|uniref:DUF305 domain-containing protein n=1 Tax=Spirilliplanes yamanashiensis TaxID=42233 RepID=A0A8J3YAZ1_9ACTN|nr:DUF305 domain-containing protein [Spirilliplanes yamanashiensis]MDP9817772.1 uncharacterized protein (DUF305 family) [Spirilliplanes yamanashiensis]GIJ04582.1 hypothetical protein Sya03_39340 [Spirilliplanes yamanashiensis]